MQDKGWLVPDWLCTAATGYWVPEKDDHWGDLKDPDRIWDNTPEIKVLPDHRTYWKVVKHHCLLYGKWNIPKSKELNRPLSLKCRVLKEFRANNKG